MPHVTGTVFIDLNQDGIQDADDVGVAGVLVRATDGAGATTETTTGADGTYELESDAENLRLEFSGFPDGAAPGRVVGTSGPAVRFLTADSDREVQNLSLASPTLVTTQFFYDRALDGQNADQGAVLTVPYGVQDTAFPTALATFSQVGSVWGVAYQPSSGSVFVSSFLKRHAGLGPNAAGTGTTTGGIYRIDRSGDSPTTSLLIDLNAAGAAFATGADPHPTAPEFDSGDWFHDSATLPLVGKRGLGGLQSSADGRTLYTVNLNTRELVEIPLNLDGTRDSSHQLRRTPVPTANPAGSGITNFNAANMRPFAVAVKDGLVYVGVTYTAETGGTAADLRAFVYAFNPATGVFTTTPVLAAALNYPRGVASDPTPGEPGDEVSAGWRPWTSTFDTTNAEEGFAVHPQPWLTDIVFDGETMILGLRDRFGDQAGFQTGGTSAADDTPFAAIAVGDILRAAPKTSGGWQLESNGAAGTVTSSGVGEGGGPGGGEFYFQDSAQDGPDEVVTGGLVDVPGFNTVAATGNDPLSAFSGGIYTLFNSDTDPAPDVNTAGTVSARGEIYSSFDQSTFGSANGLGDLEAIPVSASVEVGDRLFVDTNANGLQDADEPGISGVVVRLFNGDTQVDSVTTGAGGDFLFDGLDPNTAYQIRIDTTQDALGGRTVSLANQGTNDELDSDLTVTGATAAASFTTGPEGMSILSLDGGFVGDLANGVLSLGDTVFQDTNNDGTMNGGETGVAGVAVELLDEAGTNVLATANTDSNGVFTFTTLDPGNYRVRLAASNFSGAGALVGFTPSTTSAADPNNDVNNDSNGTASGTLGSGGFIVSGVITLADGTEPTDDGDSDANTNLSLDFGVVAPAAAGTLTLGDTVFRDVNNDGTRNAGETGVTGVTVELLDQAGTNVLGTTTTDANGAYAFANLTAGTYRVRLAAGNFSGAGALVGFTPSTTSSANPDDNVDSDSNGTASGTLGSGGFIVSGPITLADGAEPTNDGDTDANTNLTLDFGVVPPAAAGTLTLGNTVFRDTNNNGTTDPGEVGVAGVLVELLDQAGTSVLGTATTDANGLYTFPNLADGTYRVRLAASNFSGAGALVGFTPSTVSSSNPDDNLDGDNNGTASGTLGSGGFIVSGPITLAAGAEPTNDGDTDANTNLTLDFGVVPPAAAGTLTLGNLVFKDTNNNGLKDTGETGMDGVTVQLLNSTGSVVQTTTTAGGGLYTFTNLAAGDYRVRLAEANFQAGGPLVGFTASTVPAPDPDNDTDNDNNGSVSGTLGQANGFIQSGLITLALGGEPTNDGDTDANTNLSLDFGVVQSSTIVLTLGDKVFRDANNNGTFDTGEVGLSGVSVQLLDPAGAVLRTTTTDSAGTYTFGNLVAGDYRVRLPASNFNVGGALFGFTSSTGAGNAFEGAGTPDPDNNVNNDDNGNTSGTLGSGGFVESGLITLSAAGEPINDGDTNNNTNLSLDLGLVPPAHLTLTLGNTVWNDVNNNGLLDSGEAGIAGVTVQLLNAAGTVLKTAVTNSQGQYTFTGLAAGDYRVRLAASNFTGTGPLVGFTSSTGTNGSATGAFEGVGVPDPDNNTDNDDNGQVAGTLGGTGFIQTGLITLSQNSEPTNDGDLDPNTNQTLDLGVFRKFSVGNLVFNDLNNNGTRDAGEPGIAGVVVRLLNADLSFALVGTATTDAQGRYLFTNLRAGNYAVDVAANNFNTGGALFSFQSSTGVNNAFEPAPGTATDNQDHGTATGPLGSGGSVQSQTIVIGPGMPTGEDPNNDPNTPDAQSNLSIDFGMFQLTPATGSLAGRVFLDFNNSGTFNAPDTGLQGVVLTLTGGNLASPMTVQTDAQGNFLFTNLAAGTYTLSETQPASPANQSGKDVAGTAGGNTTVANTISNIVLGAGQHATGYVFAEVPLLSTGGAVFEDKNGNGLKDGGEPGIPGVTITLTGTSVVDGTIQARTAVTDATGSYTFGNLTPGTYNLAETQPAGFVDGKEQNGTPAAATVTNDHFTGIHLASATTSGGFNFGETKAASISGVVYDDVNDDGAQAAAGEVGIAGVTVKLTGTNDLGQSVSKSTTTAADGTYSFTDLRPGTYRVVETQPAKYQDGKDTAGTSAGNATAVNDQISNIVLASGATATGYLFGEHATADVVMTMTPTNSTVLPGGNVVFTLTVKNRGTAAASAVVVDVKFGGMTFVSSDSADFDSATKKWTVGDLAAGATKTIHITLKAPTASTFGPSAHATTTSTELSTLNNTASAIVSATGSITPPPIVPPTGSLWFLSSSTNAVKIL